MKRIVNCFSHQWCKDYMKEKGITQRAMADKLGCGQDLVNYWLNGKCCPSLYVVAKIAKVLECSVDDLIEEVD